MHPATIHISSNGENASFIEGLFEPYGGIEPPLTPSKAKVRIARNSHLLWHHEQLSDLPRDQRSVPM